MSEHKTKEDPLFGYMADKAMQQMSEVYHAFREGDATIVDAIHRLLAIGHLEEDAFDIVREWAEELSADEEDHGDEFAA